MKHILQFFVSLLLLFGLSLSSFAQHNSGQTGLTVYGSFVTLTGGQNDDSNINYCSGISLKYSFSKFLTSEISLGLGWIRPRGSDSPFSIKENTTYKTYLYPLNVNLRYNFFPDKSFVPFIGFGIGLTYWDLRDISQGDEWFPFPPSGESITNVQTNFSLIGSIGATIFFSHKIGFELSARYYYLLDQTLDNVGTGDINNQMIELRAGLTFYWGSYSDVDGDGIEDYYDVAPRIPEDFDNFEDEDGAPEPDNDKDGILDQYDQAPNLPEDMDGFQDTDGVPDIDNDKDGIVDEKDNCINEPEDIDGFQDEDGCPDFDNDEDGIPDYQDQCPNQKETFNNYQDDDGCPDDKPQPEFIEVGKNVVLYGVTFATGKAELTPNAETVLDNVYEALRDNPEIIVEIRGYTDSVGNRSSNLDLSRRRAEAVKIYLVRKGIRFNRMVTFGYGEDTPIASNNTREGRAKNRRIEFVRIDTESVP